MAFGSVFLPFLARFGQLVGHCLPSGQRKEHVDGDEKEEEEEESK
jgi:hypothetical protein